MLPYSRLAGLGLLAISLPSFALDIRFEGAESASAENAAALRAFAADIQRALPPRAAELIDRPVVIAFKALGGERELGEVCPSQDKTKKPPLLGQELAVRWAQDRYDIQLHRGLLKEIVKGAADSSEIGCLHGTMYKTALATALHELGHVIDSSHRFSGSKQYRSLTDWSSGLLGPSSKNALTARSPNDYEFKNPAENFAVNFEYFLLDPEFSCRRPATSRYLSDRFGTPAARADCTPYYKVMLSPNDRSVDIDPRRIYEIDFLFASKGEAMMSRWGHAMYRLIICAPERTKIGPECRKDVSRHVVAGYRANVLDAGINSWKGLTGGYPSRIFFYVFPNIIQEYNQDELRDLFSLPLRLSDDGKAMLIERFLEQYWGYEGRYAFLSNNCATEADDALSGGVDHESSSISPLGLFGDLMEAGLIDRSLLGPFPDRPGDQAIRNGYFFPSRRPDLDAAFARLKNSLPPDAGFDFDSLDQFRNNSKPLERRRYLKAGEPRQTAALYVLEKHMSQRLTTQLAKAALTAIEERDSWPEKSRGSLDAAFEHLERLKPWNQIESFGYGIPRETELQNGSQIDQFRLALSGASRKVLDALRSAAPDLFRELRASQENLRRFGHALQPADSAASDSMAENTQTWR